MSALSTKEQNRYTQLESVIHNGLQSFIEVGNALSEIRNSKLYRVEFDTFENYCRERWGMAKTYAYDTIKAAKTVSNLSAIAEILPATESQARPLTRLEPKQQRQVWQMAVDTAPNGKITAAHVQATVQELVSPDKPHVSHNSGNNEWYTPQKYIDAAYSVMGSIDLDPATSTSANQIIKASTIYTSDTNGLNHSWFGNVWLNPPYSSDLISKFAEKLIYHFIQGDVKQAIVLVNNATETQWFSVLANHASMICFPQARIKFWKPDGTIGAPLQGQAILYFGDSQNKFALAFAALGFICRILKNN